MVEVSQFLARAVLYRAAARCFAYPDVATLAYLRKELRTQLAAAAAVLPVGDRCIEQIRALLAAVVASEDAALGLAEEHNYLFSREVLCSPYESSYAERPGSGKAETMADVAAFYDAFGLRLSAGGELPDHIGVELELLAVLYAKEGYALEQGWAEQAEVSREARERFLAEHLGQWLAPFAQRIEQHARLAFYPALIGFVMAVVAAEPTCRGVVCGG